MGRFTQGHRLRIIYSRFYNIFIEKIAACYISSVGAGLALYEYIFYIAAGAGASPAPTIFHISITPSPCGFNCRTNATVKTAGGGVIVPTG